jgi:hypothetical protein
VRALVARLRLLVAAALVQRPARVARDHAADHEEEDEQPAADREHQRPVGLLLGLDRRRRLGRRRLDGRRRGKRPERASGVRRVLRGGRRGEH